MKINKVVLGIMLASIIQPLSAESNTLRYDKLIAKPPVNLLFFVIGKNKVLGVSFCHAPK
jgi:hypothetical protein